MSLSIFRRTRTDAIGRVRMALAAACACFALQAGAVVIVVDSADDASPPSAGCSLRSAVAAANTDDAVAGCTSGNGIDVIAFASSVNDIVLSQGQLVAEGELAVRGRQRVTIRRDPGAPPSRIFDVVDGNEPARLTLENIVVRNGHTTANTGNGRGGGIRSAGDVVLIDSLVAGNRTDGQGASGGGIQAAGSVSLVDSEVSDNSTTGASGRGAGIAAVIADLSRSRVLRNTASGNSVYGGGLYVDSATIADSTVADNRVTGLTDCNGGGIFVLEALLLERSLVTGNSTNTLSAGGGGIAGIGGVQLRNSTVSGNSAYIGGGLVAPLITVHNSTITDNIAGDGISGGIALLVADGVSQFFVGSSIVAGNTGDIGSPVAPATVEGSNNIVERAAASVTLPADTRDCDPALAPLADNGGDTWTHALGATSCALDTGNNPLALETDQRGAPRVAGAATDVGAFELRGESLFSDGFED